MKVYTQSGKMLIYIFLFSIIFLLIIAWAEGFQAIESSIFPLGITLFTLIILLLVILSFYKLTITVNEKLLTMKLGIGLFKKTYQLEDISHVEIRKPSLIYGIGIRYTSNGWLYNVSTGTAISLRFHNRKETIMIGCDQAENLKSDLDSRINQL